ncbi:uncharacterized protein [Heterodontus francisci]|uniref:uncharacterized protein isoform X2 n=1 Tax=Heterodontus francisci TaxID=7792 RepID=UPI00355B6194
MDFADKSISVELFQVCSTTPKELKELPFYETDIKELFEVHDQTNAQRRCKTQRPKRKYKLTHEMGEKSPAARKRRRAPPNYFVSIPVTNQQILDKIEEVQELVVTKEPKLFPAVIPVGRMHLTVVVAHLNTPAELEKAVSALQQCKSKVDAILEGKPLNLLFQGIGQFKDQVLFAKLSEDTSDKVTSTLRAVAESVEILFRELGVNIEDSNEFKPHVTFLKLSKSPMLRRKGFRKICPELYKEYVSAVFGTEVFTRIDLCSMRKKKQPSGYYHCESSINVGNSGVTRTLGSLEGSTKQVEPGKSFESEDLQEECKASAPQLTELSAIEPTDQQVEPGKSFESEDLQEECKASAPQLTELSAIEPTDQQVEPGKSFESEDLQEECKASAPQLTELSAIQPTDQQVEPGKSFESEDLQEECKASAPHLIELSAVEPTDQQGSMQSPPRSPLPHDAFTEVNHPLRTRFLHVQKEGFDTIHDDLVDLKGTIQSSLEATRVTIQNSLDLLPSAIATESGKGSAQSGLSATQTGMQELKCIVQFGMEQLERSVQSGFAELNRNIAGLSQNIADLVNVLTHTCNPVGASCQNI